MSHRRTVTDREDVQRVFIDKLIVGLVPSVKVDSKQGSLQVGHCRWTDESRLTQINCF